MLDQNPFNKIKPIHFLIKLFSIFILVYVSYILVVNLISSNFDSSDSISNYITYILFCIISCFWMCQKLHQNQIEFKNIFGKFFINYQLIMRLLVLMIIFIIFSLGITLLTLSVISSTLPSFMNSLLEDMYSNNSQTLSTSLYSYLLEAFAFVIIGPAVEEFIFRGVLLHLCAAKYKVSSSIFISSLLFGLLHLNPIGASAYGAFFALLYIKYHSLFVPIYAHIINNAIVVTAPFFAELVISDFNNMPTVNEVIDLWKISTPMIAFTTPLIVYLIYKQWSSNDATLPYFVNVAKKSKNKCNREHSTLTNR